MTLATTMNANFWRQLHQQLTSTLLAVVCASLLTQGEISNARLSSTEYSIVLTFTPSRTATNYSASFRLTRGIFWNDYILPPPYTGSSLRVTHEFLLPGSRYTVEVFENETRAANKVFQQEIATVPLPPESVTIVATGTNFLVLQWQSAQGLTYESHEVHFMGQNSPWQVRTAGSAQSFNLTVLEPGYSYQLFVVAATAGVKSQQSETVTASTLPVPPLNVTAVATGSSQVKVTWVPHPASYQESFRVEYAPEGTDQWMDTGCDQSPCAVTPGLRAGQVIDLSVSSVSHNQSSQPARVKTSTAPGIVTKLAAVAGVGSLNLSWSAPELSVQSFYSLSVAAVGSTNQQAYNLSADSPTLNFPLNSLLGGYVYKVQVRAMTLYAAGEARTDLFITIPESVSNLTGQSIDTTSVKLTWLNPQKSAVTFLNITIIQPDGNVMYIREDDARAQTRTVTGLVPGEEYRVSVTVHSQYSASQEVVTRVRTRPVKPLILSVLSGEREITVRLIRQENTGAFDAIWATVQKLEEAKISDTSGVVTFTNLTPGTQYRLIAFTVSGWEPSDFTFRTVFTKPQSVINLKVRADSSQVVTVAWELVDMGRVDNFTVVLVEVDKMASPQTKVTNKTEVEFVGLRPGTTYNVSVVANRGDQTSTAVYRSNTTAPLPVTNVRVLLRTMDMATITWDPPAGSGLSGYAVTFKPLNMTLVPVPANVIQYTLLKLTPDTNYSISVWVFSQLPDGARSFSQETRFNFSTYPESVAGLQKVQATSDSILVNWTVPASVKADFFNLGVKSLDASPPQEFALNVPGSRTNATFNGLKPGNKYLVAIRTARTISAGQQPQYGVSVRLQVVTKPLAVESLEVRTMNSSGLLVSWNVNTTSKQDKFLIRYTTDNLSRSMSLPATEGTSYQVSLKDLYAGFEYQVAVMASQSIETDTEYSRNVTSKGYTVPWPVTNLTLTLELSNLRVSWSAIASSRGSYFQVQYRLVLRDPLAEFQNVTTSQTSLQVSNLFPGEGYQVKVTAISHGLESNQTEAFVVLNPLPPKDLHVVKNSTTTTSVTIAWSYDQLTTHTSKWSFRISGGVGAREVAATAEREYQLVVDNLVPGQTYSVVAVSVVNDSSSQQEVMNVTTKPLMNSKLEASSSTNSSVTISYTNPSAGIYDLLSFKLLELPARAAVNRTALDRVLTVTFDQIQAGTKYTVEGVAFSRGEVSSPIKLEVVTDPNPVPINLTAAANSMRFLFGPQLGRASSYLLACARLADNGTVACGQQAVLSGQQEVTFSDLTPFQLYKFTVVTRSELVGDSAKEAVVEYEVQTSEDAPGGVQSLGVTDQDIHTVVLSWLAPLVLNGILRSYRVTYIGVEPLDPQSQDTGEITDINSTTTSIMIKNLKAGYRYTFQVVAVTVKPGDLAETNIVMKTTAPSFKPGLTPASTRPTFPEATVVGTTPETVTDNSISYIFTEPFTNDNGFVKYTVLVSTNVSADSTSGSLPGWADARKDSNIKVYQAIEQRHDFFTNGSSCVLKTLLEDAHKTCVFVLGARSEAECAGEEFCNGPLAENTEYLVKLRGFTASGLFQDTEYSEVRKTAAAPVAPVSQATAMIGVAVAFVATSVIVIIVVVLIVRRKRHYEKTTKHSTSSSVLGYTPITRISRPVKISDFSAHVMRMSADSDFKYAEEYEELKEAGRGQPCSAAELPYNRLKNRFTNILPYDHSRVWLMPVHGLEGSDYINANFIPGFNSSQEYIATQGPLPATKNDFWRMVWEQDSHNIVMLTRCHEKGKVKSDHYWPGDLEPSFYGDILVTLLNETHLPDWTITELQMTMGQRTRNVRHFHYTVWPDFGVPKNPNSLILFVRTVRDSLIKGRGPIIVHCSAGVGRSGTFIVLDHVLQQIRLEDEVDIFGLVFRLRQERVLMVQTEQQFKFIHECLLSVLEGREDERTYVNLAQINVGFQDDLVTS